MNEEIDFDWLHFTESDIEVISLGENSIEILVRNIFVVDVEKHIQMDRYKALSLRFFGVNKSIRRVRPCVKSENTSGAAMSASLDICDIDKDGSSKKKFEFEGVLTDSNSWVESWVIECDGVDIGYKQAIKS